MFDFFDEQEIAEMHDNSIRAESEAKGENRHIGFTCEG